MQNNNTVFRKRVFIALLCCRLAQSYRYLCIAKRQVWKKPLWLQCMNLLQHCACYFKLVLASFSWYNQVWTLFKPLSPSEQRQRKRAKGHSIMIVWSLPMLSLCLTSSSSPRKDHFVSGGQMDHCLAWIAACHTWEISSKPAKGSLHS